MAGPAAVLGAAAAVSLAAGAAVVAAGSLVVVSSEAPHAAPTVATTRASSVTIARLLFRISSSSCGSDGPSHPYRASLRTQRPREHTVRRRTLHTRRWGSARCPQPGHAVDLYATTEQDLRDAHGGARRRVPGLQK